MLVIHGFWLIKNYQEPNKAKAVKEVVEWCVTEGEKFAEEIGYIALPEDAIEKVKAVLKEIKS